MLLMRYRDRTRLILTSAIVSGPYSMPNSTWRSKLINNRGRYLQLNMNIQSLTKLNMWHELAHER